MTFLFLSLSCADAGGIPDSKEVTFNKLAGKTYPSLVVIARPSLKLKEIGTNVAVSERTALGKYELYTNTLGFIFIFFYSLNPK